MSILKTVLIALCVICVSMGTSFGQEAPPAPGSSKSVTVPAVHQKTLPDGLTVAVVERRRVPLVTIQLLVMSGAASEDPNQAGLANLTAAMLTKGTKTRTATQIAEQIEFLGGSINSGAGWNSSFVSVTVTSDKIAAAVAILSDVAVNPAFDQKELDLLKSQTLDALTYNLKQPSFLANYVASKYSFGEHPPGGTPESIGSISTADVSNFHKNNYVPSNSVLIFTGDIDLAGALGVTTTLFAKTEAPAKVMRLDTLTRLGSTAPVSRPLLGRLLVIDLPNSGQAAVSYYKRISGVGRNSRSFYPASVTNGVLGGGYSARLNYEIRIKRGLSYGAGSGIAWRRNEANLATRAQTKNESAAEVSELTLAEIRKLADLSVAGDELVPRRSVLTGTFGRNLETTNGLAAAIGDLYSFGIPTSELNAYVSGVNAVTDSQIKDFASANLLGGDIVIVGDYSIFKDDLAKRFPNVPIDVIKADGLDLSKDALRK